MPDDADRAGPEASDPALDPRGSIDPSPDNAERAPDEPAGTAEVEPDGRSLLVRAAIAAVATVGLLLVVPVVARLFVPPINPAQRTPPGHYTSQCGWCHDRSESAKLLED
jgi:hypothetical protein